MLSRVIVLDADPPRRISLRALTGVRGIYRWQFEPALQGTRFGRIVDWALPPSILEREIALLYAEGAEAHARDREFETLQALLEPYP